MLSCPCAEAWALAALNTANTAIANKIELRTKPVTAVLPKAFCFIDNSLAKVKLKSNVKSVNAGAGLPSSLGQHRRTIGGLERLALLRSLSRLRGRVGV